MKKEALLFAAVGAFNTIVTLLLYWFLLLFMGHQLSYGITFVVGVLISWWLNSKKTFAVQIDIRKIAPYFGFYLLSYYFGRVVLEACVDGFEIAPNLAIFIVILVSLPVNFVGSRIVLRWNART